MNKKLGYYTVGNHVFERKIEALIFATNVYNRLNVSINPKSLVKWHFNDEIFNAYNWQIEPIQSLKELYYKRAKELREKYDYIIISYSGGADCHNIVMSFLDQGLHIDELYVLMMGKGSDQFCKIDPNDTDALYAHSSDTHLQTIPRLKEISLKSPNTYIRYLDVTDLVFDVFNKSGDEKWVSVMREELNPVDVARFNYSYFPEFKKTLDKYQNVGVIVGIDKPKIVIDSDTKLVYTKFLDRLTNIIPIGEYITEYTNTIIEFFYWSPDACDIICKQAHTIKKWLEINPSIQYFYETKPKHPITPKNHELARILNDRALRNVLYTNWNANWFQANKVKRDWFNESDSWFIHGAKGTKEHLIWLKGIKYIIDNTKPFIQNIKMPDAFFHWEKYYCIGKLIDTKDNK